MNRNRMTDRVCGDVYSPGSKREGDEGSSGENDSKEEGDRPPGGLCHVMSAVEEPTHDEEASALATARWSDALVAVCGSAIETA